MKEQRILSIDYGKKRIGIALSDPLFTFAYSFKTLINDKNLWENIAEIINEKKVVKVILGLPNEEKNKPLVTEISNFKLEIERRFKLEVITWDEEFTSAIAQERIIESVTKKKKRRDKGLIDRNSAAVILQEYLDCL
ncbi:MAG: Holliday junction resolvase RuvX [Bacteroidetes bacterium]|nr:Holliday junction resolvase RuvX [Bacteroidota bacterium]